MPFFLALKAVTQKTQSRALEAKAKICSGLCARIDRKKIQYVKLRPGSGIKARTTPNRLPHRGPFFISNPGTAARFPSSRGLEQSTSARKSAATLLGRSCRVTYALQPERSMTIPTRARHGLCREPLYNVWLQMRQRCLNRKHKQWKHYGGRGIKVCDRWDDFECFYFDMGDRPSPAHSVDRIDNDGDYCPANCRWATKLEQVNNRRVTRNVSFRGETKPLSDWVASVPFKIDLNTLYYRIFKKNWPADKALTTPVSGRFGRPT